MEGVLDVGSLVRMLVEALGVGLVLGEEELGSPLGGEPALSEVGVGGADDRGAGRAGCSLDRGALLIGIDLPGIPEPQGRQQMQRRGFDAAVRRGDPDQDLLGRFLRIFDHDVEVAVIVEDLGVQQLVFRLGGLAPLVGLDEVGVGECALWILVEPLHVGMRRRGVEIEVVLLDVFVVPRCW
jgi:hypothetical protein